MLIFGKPVGLSVAAPWPPFGLPWHLLLASLGLPRRPFGLALASLAFLSPPDGLPLVSLGPVLASLGLPLVSLGVPWPPFRILWRLLVSLLGFSG